ncbi:hypothetical protein MUK42_34101 [Musa troglodytarum]|uniref:Uncharacterized protein n=1 Tax=Musa troglodytarum TaxID=320322 RepID=A0A9E7FAI7_9LILI|nr:hypothetical protein MUK42_34101 [Musa troglodytarum]
MYLEHSDIQIKTFSVMKYLFEPLELFCLLIRVAKRSYWATMHHAVPAFTADMTPHIADMVMDSADMVAVSTDVAVTSTDMTVNSAHVSRNSADMVMVSAYVLANNAAMAICADMAEQNSHAIINNKNERNAYHNQANE